MTDTIDKPKLNGRTTIVKTLYAARNGLSSRMVHKLGGEPYESLQGTRVMLSMLAADGLVYVDGLTECCTCGSEDACYRITAQGRIYLNNKGLI